MTWEIVELDEYAAVVVRDGAAIALVRIDGFHDPDDPIVRGHVQSVEGMTAMDGGLRRRLGGSSLSNAGFLRVEGPPTADAVRRALGGEP